MDDVPSCVLQAQTKDIERQIKEKFEKLHLILRNEEAARVAALTEEEEQRSQMMKDETSTEVSTVVDKIRQLEERTRTAGATSLQVGHAQLSFSSGVLVAGCC